MQGSLEVDVVPVRQPQQEAQHVRALVLDRLATVGVVEQHHLLVGLEEAELLQQLGGLRRDAGRKRLGGVVAVPLTGRTERQDRSVQCVDEWNTISSHLNPRLRVALTAVTLTRPTGFVIRRASLRMHPVIRLPT